MGDMLVIRDERYDLRADHDLVLTRVGDDDGGDYSCEIEADAEYPIVITHRVEVLGKWSVSSLEGCVNATMGNPELLALVSRKFLYLFIFVFISTE